MFDNELVQGRYVAHKRKQQFVRVVSTQSDRRKSRPEMECTLVPRKSCFSKWDGASWKSTDAATCESECEAAGLGRAHAGGCEYDSMSKTCGLTVQCKLDSVNKPSFWAGDCKLKNEFSSAQNWTACLVACQNDAKCTSVVMHVPTKRCARRSLTKEEFETGDSQA